jgi:CheY-like chemotaxis protein/two-component sensor histidine kinase
LRLASLAKDDFLATLSHELRTPLSAMLGWIRLARSNQLDHDRMAHALDVIERNARTQAKLIEDLLDVSRIISGKMRLDVQAINLLDVVRAALESIRPSAEAKSNSLHSVLDPGASIIMGDPARLQQVVWNLLSNAVKFTPKEGRVHLHLTRAESSAAITISDNGEGIDLDFLPHVFDRFRQAYGGIDRTHQGLGLGLAIVRHLVELHGGTVSAFSEGKGHGAIFTVHLPLSPLRVEPADVPAGGVLPVSDVDCPPQLQGLRVLVVDDEPDARELLLAELSRCGAVVQLAETAAEALQQVSAWRPDALVSDIGLPQMDGYMLIQTVRRLPDDQGGRTPALALTAYASSKDRVRAFRAGFQAHLAKPIELHELLAVLASISGRIG